MYAIKGFMRGGGGGVEEKYIRVVIKLARRAHAGDLSIIYNFLLNI